MRPETVGLVFYACAAAVMITSTLALIVLVCAVAIKAAKGVQP